MERTVEVATGESVAFSYELAGLGSRFLAVFIDTAIQFCVALVVLVIFAAIGAALPSQAPDTSPAGKLAQALVVAMFVVAAFLLFFGYFIFFEAVWSGRTPGKRIVGIRVVRDGGFPVDFTSVLIRNVVRMIEFGLGFYAISAISALLSPQNRRLGDYAAGTVVVRDRFAETAATALPRWGESESEDPLVRDLGPRERDLVRRYVTRRSTLVTSARRALAAQIAGIVRPHLAAQFAHLDDDELLVHVAGALH